MLGGEGDGVARGEDPRGADVDAVAELIVGHHADVVPPVVLGRERVAIVEHLSLTVEEAHRAAPGVAHPAREVPYLALRQHLDTVAPSTARHDEILPVLAAAEEGGAVLVLDEVIHIFVVGLDAEVGDAADAVEDAAGHLVALHRLHPVGHRHPQVGGQRDAGGGEQVHILAHPGIAHLERQVGREHHATRHTGLQRGIEGALHTEGAEVEAVVDLESFGEAPVVLHEGHHLVSRHGAADDSAIHLEGAVHLNAVVVVHTAASHLGLEPMACKPGTITHAVVGIGGKVKVDARRRLTDAGTIVALDGRGTGVARLHQLLDIPHDSVLVLRVGTREVHEQLGRELVVPA